MPDPSPSERNVFREDSLKAVSGTDPTRNNPAKVTPTVSLVARELTESDVDQAVELFRTSPGWESYTEEFREDALYCIKSPPSAMIGVFKGDSLLAVGAIIKEKFDFAYWSVTWVMVEANLRGGGLGKVVMQGMEDYAASWQKDHINPNCRVILSAVGAEAASFYEKLGYVTILEGPLDNGERLMYKDVLGPGLPQIETD